MTTVEQISEADVAQVIATSWLGDMHPRHREALTAEIRAALTAARIEGAREGMERAAVWFDAQPEISKVTPAHYLSGDDSELGTFVPEQRTHKMFSPAKAAAAIRALAKEIPHE